MGEVSQSMSVVESDGEGEVEVEVYPLRKMIGLFCLLMFDFINKPYSSVGRVEQAQFRNRDDWENSIIIDEEGNVWSLNVFVWVDSI